MAVDSKFYLDVNDSDSFHDKMVSYLTIFTCQNIFCQRSVTFMIENFDLVFPVEARKERFKFKRKNGRGKVFDVLLCMNSF